MSSEKCNMFEITTSSLCLASLLEKSSTTWSSQSSNITTTSSELQNQLFTPMVRIRNNVAITVSTLYNYNFLLNLVPSTQFSKKLWFYNVIGSSASQGWQQVAGRQRLVARGATIKLDGDTVRHTYSYIITIQPRHVLHIGCGNGNSHCLQNGKSTSVLMYEEVSQVTLFLVSFRPTVDSRYHDKRIKLLSQRTASPNRSWHKPTGV